MDKTKASALVYLKYLMFKNQNLLLSYTDY